MQLREQGWYKWNWEGTEKSRGPYEINYVKAGEKGVPIVLVHGFGAHAFHWRYQIPALSEKYRVYSLCLLGYGWSPKVVTPYSGELWGAQVADFVREVVGEPAVICGNSIGALAALSAAAAAPDFARGLVMLNAAGRFDAPESAVANPAPSMESEENPVAAWFKGLLARVVSGSIFFSTKYRIGPILKQVYVNQEQVDEDLIRSIQRPAEEPQALEAFHEISQAGARTKTTVPELLGRLPAGLPVLLVWGQKDPWMGPAKGQAVLRACVARGLECTLEPMAEAGHCPHDDDPDAVNAAIDRFCSRF